jgi:hypothetical protein
MEKLKSPDLAKTTLKEPALVGAGSPIGASHTHESRRRRLTGDVATWKGQKQPKVTKAKKKEYLELLNSDLLSSR